MKKDNIISILKKIINYYNIPVTQTSILEEVQKHPNPLSMLAISDILNIWKIPNGAYQLNIEEIVKLDRSFTTYLSSNEFVFISEINDKRVIVSNDRWVEHSWDIEEFRKLYSGTILIAESDTLSGEYDYKLKHRSELITNLRLPFVIGGSAFLLFVFLYFHKIFSSWPELHIGLLFLVKTAGLIVTILLLLHGLDENNPLIQKFCNGEGNNCNAILSSRAAKVTNELSWSEVGFFYFSGTWLILLFHSTHVNMIAALAAFNLICLPYSFYSIYYQWRVARQWCLFCCTVQVVLWFEFFLFLPYTLHGIERLTLVETSDALVDLGIPVILWILAKPYLQLSGQILPLKEQLINFKGNLFIFNKILNESKVHELLDDEVSLIIGNREAGSTITIVSNPYCGPCARLHAEIDRWLESRDDLKLQMIFMTPANRYSKITKTSAHLMSLQGEQNDEHIKNALSNWYGQKKKSMNDWIKQNPSIKETEDNYQLLNKQRKWCKNAGLQHTPVIFINGQQLPSAYQLSDIKYFI